MENKAQNFCNPYSPWEKGSNKNFNRVLRQTYPKGTIFSDILDDELERTVEKIRNRPRKILNYFTANAFFFENMWWCGWQDSPPYQNNRGQNFKKIVKNTK